MLKKRLISIISVAMFFSLVTLAGCKDDVPSVGPSNPVNQPSNTVQPSGGTQEAEKVDVSFFVDGEQYGETAKVDKGGKVTKPTDPTKAETDEFTYQFSGWYPFAATDPWDFDNDVVSENLELFAEFEETAKVYDLTVWVYGGSSSNTYITEEEAERVEEYMKSLLEGKSVYVKYFDGISNAAFNAGVLNAEVKPDAILSGANIDKASDNPLTLKSEQGKTSVGNGWFSNDSRYVGVLNSCVTEHFDAAKLFYDSLVANGPDYMACSLENAILVNAESTKQIDVTLATDDTRKPTFTSKDETIVTVDENGLVTAKAIGSTEVEVKLGIVTYSVKVDVVGTYESVVYVYGTKGSGEDDVYITKEESDALKTEFLTKSSLTEQQVYWKYAEGLGNSEFNKLVNDHIAQGFIIDVVVSGPNLDKEGQNPISVDKTNGPKKSTGETWFAYETARKVAITEACDANLNNAKLLHEIAVNPGPGFEGVVVDEEVAVTLGQQLTLTAKAYGAVSWLSSDETVATIDENGVVSGLKVGEATITATAADGGTDTCLVKVMTPKLIVLVHGANTGDPYFTEDESETLKAEFLKVSTFAEEDIVWMYKTGFAATKIADYIGNAEVILGGANMNDYLSLNETSGYTKIKFGAGWVANSSRYIGILNTCSEDNLAAAKLLRDTFSVVSYNYEGVSLDKSEVTLLASETVQLNATVYGKATWTSSNQTIATVDENGLVTAVASGETTITALAPDGKTDTCAITVVRDIIRLNPSTIDLGSEGLISYKSDQIINSTFTIKASSGSKQNVDVEKNSKTFEGTKYTQRLKLGGKGNVDYRTVAITTTGAATIKVIAMSAKSTEDRVGALFNSEFSKISENHTFLGSGLTCAEFTVDAAGTYLFGSDDSGINVYEIIVIYH